MTDDAPLFKEAATDSLQLVVELFNRPHDTGRDFSTVILLNHSLEMLLKSIIKGHGIKVRKDGHIVTFGKCINCLENGRRDAPELAYLSEEQVLTLKDIASQRNEATHGTLNISEQRLHGFARSGLTIFDELLDEFYDESVGEYLPDRVLPLSAMPLKRLDLIYREEYDSVRELLEQGAEEAAKSKLRSIEASERTLEGEDEGRVSDEELEEKLSQIEDGEDISELYPGVSGVQFSVDSDGASVNVKMTRSEGTPVRNASGHKADELDYAVGYREVNPLSRYGLSITKLSEHIDGVTYPKVWAIVRKLDIHGNEEYHKDVRTSDSQTQDRYTDRAIDRIEEALESDEVDPEKAWQTHGWQSN